MKQNITPEQLTEISSRQFNKLASMAKLDFLFWDSQTEFDRNDLLRLSARINIGKIIEMLDQHSLDWKNKIFYSDYDDNIQYVDVDDNTELTDCLWQILKSIL